MIAFDSNDPFPLLPKGAYALADAQVHAAQVDDWLGLRTQVTESGILEKRGASGSGADSDTQFWIGLPVQTLLTPYVELREILERLDPGPGETIVDLGAGYGRLGFVMARHRPDARFVGYEAVAERVIEGQQGLDYWKAGNARLIVADLADPGFEPASAEFYFLYDFGSRDAIAKCLADLRRIAARRPIVVVGRGRSSRDAIERDCPWLSQVAEPEHLGNYSIYRTVGKGVEERE